MSTHPSSPDKTTKLLRTIARALGTLMAAFWLFIVVMSVLYEPGPLDVESAILAVLILFSVAGVILAWFREGPGGAVLVLVGLAHCAFAYIAAGHNQAFAILVSGGPFLLIGLLFLLVWRRLKASQPD